MTTSEPFVFSYQSMGTSWSISLWDHELISKEVLEALPRRIFELSDAFDHTYSRFITTSLVWNIARGGAGTYEVPTDFTRMLRLYFDLYEPTERKLNPLIGYTISDMGYDAEYSLVPKEIIRMTPDLVDTVTLIDDTHISVTQSVLFDFGALGKGYFVDRIAEILKQKGIARFLVDGSGDIYYQGTEPLKAGLEHPQNQTHVIGVTDMYTGAMCASGIGRRAWDKYHHVIDPETNSSTQGISAVWVKAETAALADALASCLFFVPPSYLQGFSFTYCIMNQENTAVVSAGFQAELFG